ncbi:hypothetical protein ACXYTP_23850 [Tsukamurella ocularis]
MSAVVKTPVKGYNGIVAGVTFTDGVGETDNAAALAYFKSQGYDVSAKKDDDAEAKAKADEAKASQEAADAKAAEAKASTPKPAAKPAATKSSAPAAE